MYQQNEEKELLRHIDKWLIDWKNNPNHKPALIKDIRQSNKTHSVNNFINWSPTLPIK